MAGKVHELPGRSVKLSGIYVKGGEAVHTPLTERPISFYSFSGGSWNGCLRRWGLSMQAGMRPDATPAVHPYPFAFMLFLRRLQPFFPPNPFHTLVIDRYPMIPKQSGHHSVSPGYRPRQFRSPSREIRLRQPASPLDTDRQFVSPSTPGKAICPTSCHFVLA